jgi:hypothetical protein
MTCKKNKVPCGEPGVVAYGEEGLAPGAPLPKSEKRRAREKEKKNIVLVTLVHEGIGILPVKHRRDGEDGRNGQAVERTGGGGKSWVQMEKAKRRKLAGAPRR